TRRTLVLARGNLLKYNGNDQFDTINKRGVCSSKRDSIIKGHGILHRVLLSLFFTNKTQKRWSKFGEMLFVTLLFGQPFLTRPRRKILLSKRCGKWRDRKRENRAGVEGEDIDKTVITLKLPSPVSSAATSLRDASY